MPNDHNQEHAPLAKLTIQGAVYETTLTKKFLKRKPWAPHDPRKIACVIPGNILKLYVKVGMHVTRGQPLLVLEAMKMQNDIVAEMDGNVKTICVTPGSQVKKGQVLLELD